jgi:hypothetical protein
MSRGGIKTDIIESSVVGLGGNQFETGSIIVPAGGTIPAGAVLKRSYSGIFELVTNLASDTPVAVNPFDIPNNDPTGHSIQASMRAIIFGPVRADKLNLNGSPITAEKDFDKIRANSLCIPIQANDISRTS